ncbi:sialidase family protein [Thalassobellus citreus]|uniref:sialidase family protein n=1 Tax=Thalassobellus citreus TaxID=3367752 RepID=UPI0037B5D677
MLKHLLFLLLIASVSCTSIKNNQEIKNIKQTNIFNVPITKSCHASTLVEVTPNKIMAAWFGGSYEGAKDVGIYTASFDGNSWTTPNNIIKPLITENDTLPCWNPVLFKSKSNLLYLFYKIGKNPREWFGAMVKSTNNGKNWSKPEYLPEGFLGPIRNKPIETSSGVILCGSSTESIDTNEWRVHLEEFTESTNKWKKINIEDKNNFEIIQPTFLLHSKHTIQMLCRSKHNKIIASWSEDNGKHWIKTDSINVINSNSGIDALTISKNAFLLVNNPLKQGPEWFYGRNILDVEFSNDGLNWKPLFDLENEEKGEFSYPAIIQTSDKKIHILYTYNREFIKHTSFNLEF